MLTHPKAPPDTPPISIATHAHPPVQGLRLGHVVKSVLHRQPVTPAASTPCPQPGEAPARLGCLQCFPFSSVLAAKPMGKGGGGGYCGDQARTVPGLSLVRGLQIGLAVQVGMER